MRDYLISKGISKDRIIMENRSETTIENILFSKEILEDVDPEYYSVGIVTNNFHAFSGYMIACKQGLRNVSVLASYSHPRFLLNNILRECLGIIKDFFKGNL